jgi:outer membrane protein TolC
MSRPWFSLGLLVALTAPVMAPTAAVAAHVHTHAKPLTLTEVLAEVRTRNPGLAAERQRAEAARARVEGSGLLPDPMVEASLMSVTRLMGPQLTVGQTLPLGGKLAIERRMAAQEAALAALTYREALNAAIAEAKQAYHELAYTQTAAAVLERRKATLEAMAKVATAKYAVGGGRQTDALKATSEVAELLHARTELDRERDIAHATLYGLLNRSLADGHGGHPIVAAPLITPARRPDTATLMVRAERDNPTLALARAELALAELRLEQAKTIATPDVTARLGVGQAFMGTMGGETAVSAMVGANLPYWNGRRREQAAVTAAEAEIAARKAELEARRRQVQVGIRQALAQLTHLDEQARLFGAGLMPQGRQVLQSELTAYQVNRGGFDAVIAAQNTLFDYETGRARAIADHQKTLAELERLTGQEVPAQEAP